MATFFVEQFGAGQGIILGIQAKQEGDDSVALSILDIHIDQTNLSPKRAGYIDILINTNLTTRARRIHFELTDEAYDQRTLQGYPKKRNPEAVTK